MNSSPFYRILLLFFFGMFVLASCNSGKGLYAGLIADRQDAEKLVKQWALIVKNPVTKDDLEKIYHDNFTSFRGKKLGDYNRSSLDNLHAAIVAVKAQFDDEIFIKRVVYGDKYSEAVVYFVLKRTNKATNVVRYSEWIGYLELNSTKIRRELLLMGPTDEPDEPNFGGGGDY